MRPYCQIEIFPDTGKFTFIVQVKSFGGEIISSRKSVLSCKRISAEAIDSIDILDPYLKPVIGIITNGRNQDV